MNHCTWRQSKKSTKSPVASNRSYVLTRVSWSMSCDWLSKSKQFVLKMNCSSCVSALYVAQFLRKYTVCRCLLQSVGMSNGRGYDNPQYHHLHVDTQAQCAGQCTYHWYPMTSLHTRASCSARHARRTPCSAHHGALRYYSSRKST